MKKTIRVTAKKVEDAINQGLEMLGVSIGEAEITVISSGGLFKKAEVEISVGVDDEPAPAPAPAQAPKATFIADEKKAAERAAGQKADDKPERTLDAEKREAAQSREPRAGDRKPFERPAPQNRRDDGKGRGTGNQRFEKKNREPRPDTPATEEIAAAAEAFLSKTLALAGISATLKSDISDGLAVTIDTEDSAVIGHRGETLDAFQYLTSLVVNDGSGKYVQVSVDALGYRARRADSLKRLAEKMADKCVKSGRRVSLEPMNSSDRKEIHAFLSENVQVVTKSEGAEPNRKIVIYPARS